jgi:AraC-like DNA-binding protein
MGRSGDDGGRVGAKDVLTGANRLTPRASHADFAASPLGSYLAGGCWVYAWPHPSLCVSALFGEPGPDDIEALTRLFALELVPPASPHASIIDARRLKNVDPTAFAVLAAYVEEKREEMERFVTRLAIVRPNGFVGALAAGFYEAVPAPYPVESFEDLTSALAWTGGEDPALEDRLAAIVSSSSNLPDIVRDVRRVIEARLPDDASIDRAAADLGVAVRTLQRRLGAAQTTFRSELAAVQIARAKHWLANTDAPISRIAYEVGLSTPQHLSSLFRKATGQTPTEYRESSDDD